MKLKDKIIAIYVADIFEDMGFWYPKIRMIEEGAEADEAAGASIDMVFRYCRSNSKLENFPPTGFPARNGGVKLRQQ